jgi:hypothetical protein
MKGLPSQNIISAATVARLVKIKEYTARINAMQLRGSKKTTAGARSLCNRCQWDLMDVCSRLPLQTTQGNALCSFFHKKEERP